jgi:superfamily II DNA or RNA helicase
MSSQTMMSPGCIVRCRNRDWVLLPSDSPDQHLLRPLTGAIDEVVAVHKRLADLVGYDLPEERVRAAAFPLPSAKDLSDAASAQLLWQAARLTLREGATPFRSLGRISIRPRVYQFVPLLMALRLDPVRLFIADDVGVGKTIEALLIARELLDRGEIRRMVVLCPPYLCDQWQKELAAKFNLDAVIIRSGTIGQLENRKTDKQQSIYQYYPIQVASIDFLKTDRNRHQFLLHCPDFVIVDEAHGAANATQTNQAQQQRHLFLREIAANKDRHLILLTATPHSGIEAAFQSLLSLVQPQFGEWDIANLDEARRIELARHFVQRTRRDIEHDWEGEHCFPKREPDDKTYRLSPAYLDLFHNTYDFCSEIVRAGQSLNKRQQRVRYWGALALLRCVMSSPAAALAALATRHDNLPEAEATEDEVDFRRYVFEATNEQTDDEQPTPPVESAAATLDTSDRRRLRELGQLAGKLHGNDKDTKLTTCAELATEMLTEGFQPIIWCRYIATAEYVAEGLRKALARSHPKAQVVAITGRVGDEERRAKIDAIDPAHPRILVATDCLSEGINLQDKFNAALHYDLPWNPNRLEQREGRVDRYGQPSSTVRTIRYFSPDSAVDGVVLDVLLNKAREIHKALGTHVPVPEESETVTEAVLNALFLRGRRDDNRQLAFDFGLPAVEELHQRWDRDKERERSNRTRFAQHALKPQEVRNELESTDAVLGDPNAVRDFVLAAAQRLNLHIEPDRKRQDVFRIALAPTATANIPEAVRFVLPQSKGEQWLVSFVSPTPEGAEYVGRNHRFVATLARFLMEEALTRHGKATASRCGVIRTRAVSELTTLLLLRVRYLIEQPQRTALLSEEVLVSAYTNITQGKPEWMDEAESLRLLTEAQPDANVPMEDKRKAIEAALADWPVIETALQPRIKARAAELEQSHKRIRQAVSLRVRELTVKPQLPPDLLGILVLQPNVV